MKKDTLYWARKERNQKKLSLKKWYRKVGK